MASPSTRPASCSDTPCTLDSFSNLNIAINQVEYSKATGGPVIHIFGRDNRGKAARIDVTGFRPYFYIPADEAASKPIPPQTTLEPDTLYTSIRSEKLRRLYTQQPTDVRDVRERFRHFEADIPFATRFMIDCGLTGGVSVQSSAGDGNNSLPAGAVSVVTVDFMDLKPADVDAPARSCIIDIECEDERGFPDPQRDAINCITCYDSFEGDYVTFLLIAGVSLRR